MRKPKADAGSGMRDAGRDYGATSITELDSPPPASRTPHPELAARAATLRQQIEQASYEYHVLDRPEISDAQYDRLFRELQTIEAEHPELRTDDSPTLRVGAEPTSQLAKHTHLVPMLSLANAFNDEELEAWHERLVRIA